MIEPVSDPWAITPVQRIGQVQLKRDDLFRYGPRAGSTVRTALLVAQGARGLACTEELAADVQAIAELRDLPWRAYADPVELAAEAQALGWAELIPYDPEGVFAGYRRTVASRQAGYLLPAQRIERVVVPVVDGATLAGIVVGLQLEVPIVGVVSGDPTAAIWTLDQLAPGWRSRAELVDAPARPLLREIRGIALGDAEALCTNVMRDGDLLWLSDAGIDIVGDGAIVATAPDGPSAEQKGDPE